MAPPRAVLVVACAVLALAALSVAAKAPGLKLQRVANAKIKVQGVPAIGECDIFPTVQNPMANRFNLAPLAAASPFTYNDPVYGETYTFSFCSGHAVQVKNPWYQYQLDYKSNGVALNHIDSWGAGAQPSENGGLAFKLINSVSREEQGQIVLLCGQNLFEVDPNIYHDGLYRGFTIRSTAGCSSSYFQGCYSKPMVQNPSNIRFDFAPLAVQGPFTVVNPTNQDQYTFSFCNGVGFTVQKADGSSMTGVYPNSVEPYNPHSCWGAGVADPYGGGIACKLYDPVDTTSPRAQFVILCNKSAGSGIFDVELDNIYLGANYWSFTIYSPVGCGVDA